MIKRYDLINVPCHGGCDSYDELQEVEDGGWVRYDDHAAEVERLRDTFDRTRHQVCDALELDRGLGWTSLCMEIAHIYYDHAVEVERLRAENERLRAELDGLNRIGKEALREAGHPNPDEWGIAFAVGWLENRRSADRDAQREAAVYGAAWAENARFYNAKIIDPVECAAAASEAAEKAVEIWRAAQKGGSDG